MMIISSKAHQLCGSQPTETLPVGAVSSLLALKKGPIRDAQCYAFTILFTFQRRPVRVDGGYRARTDDLRLAKAALSQLS